MARLIPKKLHRHFWNEERGLTSIFILLCISNFLVFPFFPGLQILLRIFWLIILIAGISSLAKNRRQIRLFSVIPVLMAAVIAAGYLFPDRDFFPFIELAVELSAFALLTGMVLMKVFEDGQVTIHRVIGSIVVYMLFANVWSVLYYFLFSNFPGSILIPEVHLKAGAPPSVFLYFSYTTLTTTGYGELLPVSALARTLAIVEQLIGVLYPVVLIGRLVSLIASNPRKS
jgi:hypothetical protein